LGGTLFKITSDGTLTTLYSFCSLANCADGREPYAGLVQATDGDLYGTTDFGGANDRGTVFKITPNGALTTLYSFCSLSNCVDGYFPHVTLVQALNGELYGTTPGGGTSGEGTVFKITPSGTLMTVYSFCSLADCADGSQPDAGLVQAANGDLYGTTDAGGAHGHGSVFADYTAETKLIGVTNTEGITQPKGLIGKSPSKYKRFGAREK
jgi:uncharacterized repeat protein (TIGR03803 family)